MPPSPGAECWRRGRHGSAVTRTRHIGWAGHAPAAARFPEEAARRVAEALKEHDYEVLSAAPILPAVRRLLAPRQDKNDTFTLASLRCGAAPRCEGLLGLQLRNASGLGVPRSGRQSPANDGSTRLLKCIILTLRCTAWAARQSFSDKSSCLLPAASTPSFVFSPRRASQHCSKGTKHSLYYLYCTPHCPT